MSKAPPKNTCIVDDTNFQLKLSKFKKKWLTSWNGSTLHQNQIIFKNTSHENKTHATKKSSAESSHKRLRRKTTINPGGVIKRKDSFSRYPVGKCEKTLGQYSMIIDKSKVNKTSMNLDTSKKTLCSQLNFEETSKQKKKYRRKRSECLEKLPKFQNDENYENSSSAESSNIKGSANALRNYTTVNDANSTSKNENTTSKNSQQQSSFRLRSPILFRSADKPKSPNKFAQSSVTITTDIGTERGGFASSDRSFSFRKFEWGSHSVRSRKLQDHQQTPNSLSNNALPTSYNKIHDHRSENQQNVLSWLRSLKHSESDVRKFSDDSENSITLSLKYSKKVSANALVEKNYTHNIEMEMSSSTAFSTELQNFAESSLCNKDRYSNLSPDCFGKVQNLFSSVNHEKRLFSQKRPMQWYGIPGSLESSMSSSKEKLNKIKGFH